MAKISNKNKPENRMKRTPVNSNWFQNVSKSMGFAAADLVKDLVPNTTDFLSYNASDTMELIRDMRTQTGSRNNLTRQISSLPHVGIAKDAFKNALDDIKSGNIVNKDRATNWDDDEGDFGFGSFGNMFDEDDGLEFFGDDEDNGDVTINKNTVNNVVNSLPLAKTIAASTEVTVNTMTSIAEQNLAIETEKMMFNHRSTNSLLGGISAMNDNLSTIVKFHGDSTSKYYAASIKYYEESLDELKGLVKQQKDMYGDKISDKAIENYDEGIYTYTGGLKINQYKKMIQENLTAIKDESAALTSMADAFTDLDTLKAMAKNPMGTMMKFGLRSMVPVITKTSVAAIDASLSSVIPAVMAKINTLEDEDNPVMQYIYKVFGSKNKLSYDVKLGDYEKGAIPYDGESKKALVEVIPAHLRRIEAALTGQKERFFDYGEGEFVDIDKLQSNYKKKLGDVEGSGYTDVRIKMRQIARELDLNKKTMDQFEKDMSEYFSAVTKKGSVINPYISTDKEGISTDFLADSNLFDGDQQRIDLMRTIFKGVDTKDLIKMSTSGIYDSRKATEEFMNEIRKNPNVSGYNVLKNKSVYDENDTVMYDPTKTNRLTLDKHGLGQLDYLRDIRSILINGIKVFPDNRKRYKGWNPNLDIQQRMQMESRINTGGPTVNESEYTMDYDRIENMSRSNIQSAYDRVNAENASENGKDGKFARRISHRFNRVNSYMDATSEVIDNQIYKLLFGGNDERQLKAMNDRARLQGMYNEDNTNLGGVLGRSLGFLKDTVKGVGSYFTGKSYVKSDGTFVPEDDDSLLKKMNRGVNSTLNTLFGSNDEEQGLIDKMSKDFMDGFRQFKVTLFGEKLSDKENSETLRELTNKVKSRLPKAIGAGLTGAVVKTAFASQMGMLGSILLPGGPLGAALIGTTAGFLSQSETFKNWLFGEKDREGMRMGGFIPKSLTDMLAENGTTIKTGAIIGAGAGLASGLLPSFFLPGGPITGAVMGIGTGLLTKSDGFQKMLFGENFSDKDNRSMMNGAFGKLYKSTIGKEGKGINPKLATFLGTSGIGVGLAQGVGLLPSFLLPGGPITGAMFGLAGGIMASSDKFQEFLFGDKDVDGKRYGGLMTKFTNWFDTTVVSPFKIKATEINDTIYEFIQGKVINPFLHAFEPITEAVKFAVDDAKETMKNAWGKITDGVVTSFNDNVIKPFGESLEKYIVDPIKRQFNKILSLIGKGLGALISSPFKLLGRLGDAADNFNGRKALKNERSSRRDAFKEMLDQKRADGTLTYKDIFGGVKDQFIFGKEKEEVLNKALPYRQNRESNKQAREEKLAREVEERKAKREDLQRQYEEDVKFGKKNDWKFASKKQQEKREKELKEKEAWLQEQTAQSTKETAEKINSIDDILSKVPTYEKDKIDMLKSMKNTLQETLNKLLRMNGAPDGESIVNSVTQALRGNEQSHADGLDNVPKDGYIAELHEGEMVVPKSGAGFLRGLFGNKKDKKGNIITRMFDKMTKDEDRDRNDNPMNISRDEQEALKELQDKQKYDYAARKDVDYIQNKMKQEEKDKEEKEYRDKLIGAVDRGTEETAKGNSFWDNMFSPFGLLGKLLTGLPKAFSTLLKVLGGLGIGGAGLLGMIGGGAALNNKYKGITEEYNTDTAKVLRGYGREDRLDGEGYYTYDNTLDSSLSKLAYKGTRDTLMKPVKQAGNFINNKAIQPTKELITDKIIPGVKGIASNLDARINPTKSVTMALGSTYTQPVAREGFVNKSLGKAYDMTKEVSSKSKSMIKAFIDASSYAIGELGGIVAKVVPGAEKIVKESDKLFKKMIQDADMVVKKFGSKIATFVTDTAIDFTPIGAAVEVGMTVYDVVTGLTAGNAGNLFGVPPESVDSNMRLITSAMQGACKFSFMSIIWIINEISTSLYGMSFLQEAARFFYKLTPKIFGIKKDFSDDLKGVNTDDLSLTDIILKAGGDPSQFKDKTGKYKDFKKLNAKNLDGISDHEILTIQNAQYNKSNDTNMSRDAFLDKRSQTFGMKVMNNKAVKNTLSLFSSESNRSAMGLNTDAKLTMADRLKYTGDSMMLNTSNFFNKLMGKDTMTKQEWFGGKKYDENGNLSPKGTLSYEEARSVKNNKKIDDSNKKINELMKKNENAKGVGKWFNDMKMGYYKGKRERARDREGTRKATNQRAEQKKNAKEKKNNASTAMSNNGKGYISTNSSDKDVNDIYNNAVLEAYGYSEGESLGKGDGDANTTPKKTNKPKSSQPNKDAVSKTTEKVNATIGKSFEKLNKSIDTSGKSIEKGLSTSSKSVAKSFAKVNKDITSLSKKTSKDIKKDGDKNKKTLTKETKKMTKSVNDMVKSIDDTIKKATKDIKKIKIKSASVIKPTFEIGDPEKFIKGIFEDIFKKTDNNAGSSGVTSNLNVKRYNASDDYISTTNNTSNRFVFYNQADKRWGSENLVGGKSLKDAGCGPTSLAMVVSQMTGEQVTPDTVAKLGRDHLPGYASYSLFPSIASKLNMNYEESKGGDDSDFIISRLKKGLPVILSGKSKDKNKETPYTKDGHVVVASQLRGDKVFIQDPRGKEYSKTYSLKSIMSGLNKGMVLTPSLRTKKSDLPSSGKIGVDGSKVTPLPLGIYGDGSTLPPSKESMGKAGAKVKVADRVLSYMRAFLDQKSKFAYSQPLRDEINKNKKHADCSSFVGHVLSVAGDTPVSGTSQSMWDKTGTKVDNPQIGDIVCQQGHVGLYSGNGKYIHMSSPKNGIKESDAISKYNNPHRGYKRVLKDPNAMVDAIINGGNSLLGTVTAKESGEYVSGANGTSTDSATNAESPTMLGAFDKLTGLSQNMVGSIISGNSVNVGSAGMEPSAGESGTNPDSMNGWAYYQQTDPRWNTEGVGGSSVGKAGCGPTSYSMLLSTMSGTKINPLTMTKYAKSKGIWNADGMQWTMPAQVSKDFGIPMTNERKGHSDSTLEAIKADLKSGKPVVMSGRTKSNDLNTPFTTGGHIVLGVGVDGKNRIIVNDPRAPKFTKAYEDSGFKTPGDGLRAAWTYAKNGNITIPQGISTDGAYNGSSASAISSGAESPTMLGAFDKLSNIGQNMMASIFAGKNVDLFASTDSSISGSSNLAPGSANDYVGVISSKYETGKEGGDPGMVSSGKNDPLGGISYGIPQFSTKQGSAQSFAKWIMTNYPEYKKYFEGKTAGTAAFGSAWKQAYAEKGWEFGAIQVAKAHEDYYAPHVNRLLNKGIDPNKSRGMQEAVYSTGVQHGGATSSFNKYMGDLTSGMSPSDMIEKIYQNRINKATVKTTPRWKKEKEENKAWADKSGIAYGKDAVKSATAGKGDGNTYLINPRGSAGKGGGFADPNKATTNIKPISGSQLNKIKKLNMGTIPAGTGEKLRKLNTSSLSNISQSDINKMKRPVNTNGLDVSYIEALDLILTELKGINGNTYETAKTISDIKIVSSNEPVTGYANKNQATKQSKSAKKPNDNTGYDIARNIAGFAN